MQTTRQIAKQLESLPRATNASINGHLVSWVWYNEKLGIKTWYVDDVPMSLEQAVVECSRLYIGGLPASPIRGWA